MVYQHPHRRLSLEFLMAVDLLALNFVAAHGIGLPLAVARLTRGNFFRCGNFLRPVLSYHAQEFSLNRRGNPINV